MLYFCGRKTLILEFMKKEIKGVSMDTSVLHWMERYENEQKKMGYIPSQAWYDAMYRLAQY